MMSTTVAGNAAGTSTASITCTIPFSASRSATVTIASLIITFPPVMVTVTSCPNNVSSICPSERSVDIAAPDTTWYNNTSASAPVGSASKASSTPIGKLLKAASVGANTVKGPAAERSSSNSAAITAVSKVVWSGLSTMMSTTVCAFTANATNMNAIV